MFFRSAIIFDVFCIAKRNSGPSSLFCLTQKVLHINAGKEFKPAKAILIFARK